MQEKWSILHDFFHPNSGVSILRLKSPNIIIYPIVRLLTSQLVCLHHIPAAH